MVLGNLTTVNLHVIATESSDTRIVVLQTASIRGSVAIDVSALPRTDHNVSVIAAQQISHSATISLVTSQPHSCTEGFRMQPHSQATSLTVLVKPANTCKRSRLPLILGLSIAGACLIIVGTSASLWRYRGQVSEFAYVDMND